MVTAKMMVWYAFVTLLMACFGVLYNSLIEKREGDRIATCLKVVIGVAATEIFRVVRLIPFVVWIYSHLLQWIRIGEYPGIICFIGLWMIDVILGYGATGIPMIVGDLKRAAREQADRYSASEGLAVRAVEMAEHAMRSE